MRKVLVRAPCGNPKGFERFRGDQLPCFLFQAFQRKRSLPCLCKVGDAADFAQSALDFGKVALRLQFEQYAAGNSTDIAATAVCQDAADIFTETIFEVITIASLQAEFVVVNDDEPFHDG